MTYVARRKEPRYEVNADHLSRRPRMGSKRRLVLDIAAVLVITVAISYPTESFRASASVTCSGVVLASGTSIRNAVASYGPGTTFCLSGKYTTSTPIVPKNGDQFIGTSTTNISSSGSSVFYGGKNVTYANLGIGPSQGDGIRPGSGSTIQNSTIHDNPYCGIVTIGNSLVVRNNEIAYNGNTSLTTSRACGLKILGMDGSDSGAYSRIAGNIIHDNGHNALWVDCDAHGNTFTNNTIYRNTGIALDAETSFNNTFTGNTVHDNGFGMKLPAVSILDSIGTVIQNNTFANNFAGVRIWADRRATVSSPVVGTGCADASLTGYIPSRNSITGNQFRTEQRVGFWSSVAVSAASVDSNCYTVAQLSDTNWSLPSDTTATWTQWRNAGKDPNGAVKTGGC
jgi:parallel beta-helix repeat protein